MPKKDWWMRVRNSLGLWILFSLYGITKLNNMCDPGETNQIEKKIIKYHFIFKNSFIYIRMVLHFFVSLGIKTNKMKTIYLITLLLIGVSCSKDDTILDEQNIYLNGINQLRVNSPLNWDESLYSFCERCSSYYVKYDSSPDFNTVKGDLKMKVCYFIIDSSKVKDFDLLTYLKTNFSSYITDTKYIKFGIYTKDNITTFSFGY